MPPVWSKLLWTMVGRDPNGAATVTASWLAPCRRRKRTPALSAGSSTYPNPATVLDEAGCCEGQGELTWHNGTGTGTGISHYRPDHGVHRHDPTGVRA